MADHKATPEQWAQCGHMAKQGGVGFAYASCILELRAKIQALEANSKSTSNSSRARSSLVERVQETLGHSYSNDARAAIREVAAWLRENAGGTRAAWMLEQEVER